MNYRLLFNTIIHLRPRQVFFQFKKRLVHKKFKVLKSPGHKVDIAKTDWCIKPTSFCSGKLTFLNIVDSFTSWNETSHGMLWAYNLNYMDWLCQPGFQEKDGEYWIDRFISDLPDNKIGLDPYPIALRSINWIKFFSKYPDTAISSHIDSLYSQVKYLSDNLELHLLGNHLLEDAYSLFITGNFFNDKKLLVKATTLLRKELDEQILPDGAHYEQSPMYHCILLDRLLDCINFDRNNHKFLRVKAEKMLGHLESIIWENHSIPHLNDSADNIAPSPMQIFEYAHRLGLQWHKIQMKECGYRKLSNNSIDAIINVGDITAYYQPGHSHADTFNYELQIDNKPFIVDTGISTYEKNARRQYERSTEAHNTVTVGNNNSSEVWGGFRVGRRPKVRIIEDDIQKAVAVHNGFGKNNLHERRFEMTDNRFIVTDRISTEGVSRIHLSPAVKVISVTNGTIITDLGTIRVDGTPKIWIEDNRVSTEYNILHPSKVICITFKGTLTYTISK